MVYMCVCVCVNKYIYMMEYYLAIKNNEKTPFVDYHTKWNEWDKDKYHMISLICGTKRKWHKWAYF